MKFSEMCRRVCVCVLSTVLCFRDYSLHSNNTWIHTIADQTKGNIQLNVWMEMSVTNDQTIEAYTASATADLRCDLAREMYKIIISNA